MTPDPATELPGLFGLDVVWSILLAVVLIGMAATTFRFVRNLQEGYALDRAHLGTGTRWRIVTVSSVASLAVVAMFLVAMAAEEILPNFAAPTASAEPRNPVGCPAGRMALTFDASPHPEHTARILDILDEHDVDATFVVLGQAVAVNPAIVERMVDEGHLVAVGAWTYRDLTTLRAEELALGLRDTVAVVQSVTGEVPRLLRPPFGTADQDVVDHAAAVGLELRGWTAALDLRDWQVQPPQDLIETVADGLQDGGIVLAHDGLDSTVNTIAALPHLVELVHAAGYCFSRLDEPRAWIEDGAPWS